MIDLRKLLGERHELLEKMNICMSNALVSADMYLDVLLKINDGEDQDMI